MNASQRITLKAFLIALAQQKSPLPADLQTRLKEIAGDISANLGTLDNLGETYLGELYREISDFLHEPAAHRGKGFVAEIDEVSERRKAESKNLLDAINETDDEELKKLAEQVLNPDDTGKTSWEIVETFFGYPLL